MMKKLYLIGLTIVCLCMAFGCQVNDHEPETADSVYMHNTSATVSGEAGSYSLTIFTTCDWTATADSWITLDTAAGEQGVQAVHLSYGDNTTGAERTGSVVFKAGTYTETFTLTQQTK